MIKQEPRIEFTDLLACLGIYLGFLFFLIGLHLLVINGNGNIQSVLSTVFKVFVTIYSTSVVFGLVIVITQLLRWLTWSVTTAEWEKKKGRLQ